jgi:hypothetical protein
MQRQLLALLIISTILAGCSSDDPATAVDTSLKAPTNFTATRTGRTRVELRWDDNNVSEDGYYIERRANAGTFRMLLFTVKDVKVATDSVGLSIDTLYQYRVRAGSVESFGDYSATDSIRFTLPYPSMP